MTADPPPGALRRPRLLLVDDDDELRRALVRLLRSAYDVVAVDGGRAALALLGADPFFDVVLSDVSMSDVDGPALHAGACVIRPALAARFLFLSGTAPSNDVARYLESSGVPFLAKPVGRSELLAEIERVLRAAPAP